MPFQKSTLICSSLARSLSFRPAFPMSTAYMIAAKSSPISFYTSPPRHRLAKEGSPCAVISLRRCIVNSGSSTANRWRSTNKTRCSTSSIRRMAMPRSLKSLPSSLCSSLPIARPPWSIKRSTKTTVSAFCLRQKATPWPTPSIQTLATTPTDSAKRFTMKRFPTSARKTVSMSRYRSPSSRPSFQERPNRSSISSPPLKTASSAVSSSMSCPRKSCGTTCLTILMAPLPMSFLRKSEGTSIASISC